MTGSDKSEHFTASLWSPVTAVAGLASCCGVNRNHATHGFCYHESMMNSFPIQTSNRDSCHSSAAIAALQAALAHDTCCAQAVVRTTICQGLAFVTYFFSIYLTMCHVDLTTADPPGPPSPLNPLFAGRSLRGMLHGGRGPASVWGCLWQPLKCGCASPSLFCVFFVIKARSLYTTIRYNSGGEHRWSLWKVANANTKHICWPCQQASTSMSFRCAKDIQLQAILCKWMNGIRRSGLPQLSYT